jgi:UDP-N-acetylmuramate dehydrogenase
VTTAPKPAQIPETWEQDVVLAPFTSWKVGGPARFFSQPSDPSALASDLRAAADAGLAVFILGGGSNILIAGDGFDGLVVRYRDRSVRLQVDDGGGSARLRAGAHAPFAGTARAMAYRGWAGLEWAEGIPGTIGGAIAGNAGAYGGDVSQVLLLADLLIRGSRREVWTVDAFAFAYRRSRLRRMPPGEAVVLTGEFHLRREDPGSLRMRMAEFSTRRRSATPAGQSCGSVFRNPEGDASGRIIDGLGLKGTRCGGAAVSLQHGNYILNDGTATAAEILRLIRQVRDLVLERTGVRLVPEIQFMGFSDADLDGLVDPAPDV